MKGALGRGDLFNETEKKRNGFLSGNTGESGLNFLLSVFFSWTFTKTVILRDLEVSLFLIFLQKLRIFFKSHSTSNKILEPQPNILYDTRGWKLLKSVFGYW